VVEFSDLDSTGLFSDLNLPGHPRIKKSKIDHYPAEKTEKDHPE
jgi:hypothetical protein